MTFSADPPRLPKWIFLVGDAALMGTALFIGTHAAHPTSGGALIAIVVCVALGAICGAIPFITDYARSQDEAVDERRRSLEGLARTVTSSAEQVAITANGLHQIADLAQKNLKHAEKLTDHLREKIAELQAQVAEARESDREEIARLESASDKITKAAGDGTRLEAALRKSVAAAIAEFETKAAAAAVAIAEKAAAAMAVRVEPTVASRESRAPAPKVKSDADGAALVREAAPEPKPERSYEPPPAPSPAAAASPIAPAAASPTVLPPAPTARPDAAPPAAPDAPDAAAAAAPAAGEPTPQRKRAPRKVSPPEPSPAPEASESPAPPEFHRTEKAADDEAPEPAVSSDGATRILVTAYIGIGNRLFIRGEGPGLTWEKGIPLQFVSIGKWRWETPDATAPVRFKLYKNDETECRALGEASVGAGRQQELTAVFQ